MHQKQGIYLKLIRLYEEAVKFALNSGEDEIAQELVTKITEIIKLIPTPGKKKKKGKGKGGKGGKGAKRGESLTATDEKERDDLRKES